MPAGVDVLSNLTRDNNPEVPGASSIGGDPRFVTNLRELGGGEQGVEENFARRFSMLDQLMSGLGAIDAFANNLAARNDPTIPALINSQLGNFANFQNAGGVNPNAVLSGDFSGTNFLQPVSTGDGEGPFNVPLQSAGGNQTTQNVWDGLIGPIAQQLLGGSAQSLQLLGAPAWEIQDLFNPSGIPIANNPLPDLVPPFESPGTAQAPQDAANSDGVSGPGQFAQQRQAPAGSQPQASFEVGTSFVPNDGTFQLHQGEAVIPANQNPAAQMGPTGGFIPPAQPGAGVGASGPGAIADGGVTQFTKPQPVPTGQTTNSGVMPAQPVSQATPQPPGNFGGFSNPLEQALASMGGQLASGGPINQDIQNIANQRVADQASRAKQQQLQDLRNNFASRGIGGSGLQFGLEQAISDNALRALIEGQNQVALGAADTNFGALQNAAGNLLAGGVGAGRFGMENAAFNLGQSQSMFDQLVSAIRNTFANPSDQAANTTNVAFV